MHLKVYLTRSWSNDCPAEQRLSKGKEISLREYDRSLIPNLRFSGLRSRALAAPAHPYLRLSRRQKSRDNLLRFFVHHRHRIFRAIRRSRHFVLHSDIDAAVGRVAEVLHLMLERRIPPRFARFREHLAHLPILIGKAKM